MSHTLAKALVETSNPKIAKRANENDNTENVQVIDHQVNNEISPVQNSGIGNLSMRDLLELSAEEESEFLKELFDDDFFQQSSHLNVNNNNSTMNKIANVRPNQIAQSALPRMLFNNSTVTINFNINK